MRTEMEYEDMKLSEITEEEWGVFDYEDPDALGICSEDAALRAEEGEE